MIAPRLENAFTLEETQRQFRDRPLSVALAIGYSDQSDFTRRFKRHVGCTPGVYAREHARARLPSEH